MSELLLVVATASAAHAQELPKVNVLFGASVSNIDRGRIDDSLLPSSQFPSRQERFIGFVFSPAITVRPYLRIVIGEFGAQYRHAGVKDDGNPERSETFQLLFGPQFTKRYKRATLFGHGLVGLGRTQRATVVSHHGIIERDFGFLFSPGGGVDVNLTRHYSLRVLQVDYMPGRMDRHQAGMGDNGSVISTDVSSTRPGSWRVTVGIVIHAGY